MAEDLGDKTEDPTGKRLADAKQQSNFARSPNLAAAIDLIGAAVAISTLGAGVARAFHVLVTRTFEPGDVSLAASDLSPLIMLAAVEAGKAVGPFLVIAFVVAAISQMLQVGLNFNTQSLMPKWERLSPLKGIGNIVGKANVGKTAVHTIKMCIVGVFGAWFIADVGYKLARLPMLGALQAQWAIVETCKDLAVIVLAILLALGVVDYLWQRRQHNQKLRMTKTEVKDERRSMEGDPQVKSQRFSMYRKIVMQRLNSAVPKADVVVTNPTHYAVALKYDAKTMRAPKVVAKGADFLALKIREIAGVHGVAIVERPPLARALYATVEPGFEIPAEHYQAVAEVLAYVYRIDEDQAPAAGAAKPAAA